MVNVYTVSGDDDSLCSDDIPDLGEEEDELAGFEDAEEFDEPDLHYFDAEEFTGEFPYDLDNVLPIPAPEVEPNCINPPPCNPYCVPSAPEGTKPVEPTGGEKPAAPEGTKPAAPGGAAETETPVPGAEPVPLTWDFLYKRYAADMLFGENDDGNWSDDSYDILYTNGCTKRVHGKRTRKSQGYGDVKRCKCQLACRCQAATCKCQCQVEN